jgi:hypothetical protein
VRELALASLIVLALAIAPGSALAGPRVTRRAPAPTVDLAIGVAAGGAPFLTSLSGPVLESSSRFTAALFARLRLPDRSSRELELAAIMPHGLGLTLKNDDLRLGNVRLHLLDVGVFRALTTPVTVQRLQRRWDLMLGMSAEVDLEPGLRFSFDARMFSPLDLFDVFAKHGAEAQLIGEEILRGTQLWAGLSYRL